MSADLFRESKLRDRFDDLGFVVLPLLQPEDIAELLEVYRTVHSGLGSGFYTTLWSQDLDYRRTVDEAVRRVLSRRIERHLHPGRLVLTQFAVKPAGQGNPSECPFHQDWSFVDESKYSPVSIWCPLVDVDHENGCLSVVPGTHRATRHHRYNHLPIKHHSPYRDLWPVLVDKYAREIPMNAGECILYNGAIAHGSQPNHSAMDRVAVVAVVVPPEAQLRHYWRGVGNTVEVFGVDPDFFVTRVKVGERPEGETVVATYEMPDEIEQLTEEAFLERTAGMERTPERSRFPLAAQPLHRDVVSDDANRQLDRQGYALLDLLTNEQVAELRSLYESLGCSLNQGFHADMFSPDSEYRERVYRGLREVLDPVIERVFVDHRICIANYIVKEPSSATSEVPLHQDWTIVDPARYRSFNVFFPLTDVTVENGCLHVVSGSHLTHRLSAAPFDQVPTDQVNGEIAEHFLTPVPMRAGQGLIYDGRLLHSSPPNRRSEKRIAIGVVVVPKSAELRIYYKDQQGTPTDLEVLQVDDSFFQSFDLAGQPQGGRMIGSIPYRRELITSNDLIAWKAHASAP